MNVSNGQVIFLLFLSKSNSIDRKLHMKILDEISELHMYHITRTIDDGWILGV